MKPFISLYPCCNTAMGMQELELLGGVETKVFAIAREVQRHGEP